MNIERDIDRLGDLVSADQPEAARRLHATIESRLRQIRAELPRVKAQYEALGEGLANDLDPAIDPKALRTERWLNVSIPILLIVSVLVAGFLYHRTIAPATGETLAPPATETTNWIDELKDFFD